MATHTGNPVHLYERDCSVQRRFQKVIEVAPSSTLKEETRQKLFDYALKITRHVNYSNAGTVEFLVDSDENIYFIEVNPRVQVEHTITEEITGIDIVRSQIHIADGAKLSDPQINIKTQDDVSIRGFAVQCRITTEDPLRDSNQISERSAYRSAAGFGIRLDVGAAYVGAKVSPFYDSMLVKVSASGRTLQGAIQRAHRALREFRIRGVKTNIHFLLNVLEHPTFKAGEVKVTFLENHPELFDVSSHLDRGTKTLSYLSKVIVNGNPDIKSFDPERNFRKPVIPKFNKLAEYPEGTKNKLDALGAEGFVQWIKDQDNILFTDTTLRDAHRLSLQRVLEQKTC